MRQFLLYECTLQISLWFDNSRIEPGYTYTILSFEKIIWRVIFFFFREAGFADDITTFGVLSGLWSSAFSLGAFVGPSVAGILYDLVGFSNGTLFVIAIHSTLVSINPHWIYHLFCMVSSSGIWISVWFQQSFKYCCLKFKSDFNAKIWPKRTLEIYCKNVFLSNNYAIDLSANLFKNFKIKSSVGIVNVNISMVTFCVHGLNTILAMSRLWVLTVSFILASVQEHSGLNLNM